MMPPAPLPEAAHLGAAGILRLNPGVFRVRMPTGVCYSWMNRASADTKRAAFTIDELADLTCEFYRRNYTERGDAGLIHGPRGKPPNSWRSPDESGSAGLFCHFRASFADERDRSW